MGSQSTALWCSLRQGCTETPIETHFNYWRLAGDNSAARDFLDVGVMAYQPADLTGVSLFVPRKLGKKDVEDLGHVFQPMVAEGIFNEPLNCTQSADQRQIDLRRQDGSLHCRIYVLGDPDIEVLAGADGSVVTILAPAIEKARLGLQTGERVYFRLRIFMGKGAATPFVTVIPPGDRNFQSGYDEIEYVAFGLNEARTLPRRIEDQMQQEGGKARIVLLAFLTAVPMVAELSASSAEFHKSRLLERKIWDSYVTGGIPDGMMVYHWRRREKDGISIDNFSAFVKLRTRRTGPSILLKYLGIAFLFGVLGNLAASAIVWGAEQLTHERPQSATKNVNEKVKSLKQEPSDQISNAQAGTGGKQ